MQAFLFQLKCLFSLFTVKRKMKHFLFLIDDKYSRNSTLYFV